MERIQDLRIETTLDLRIGRNLDFVVGRTLDLVIWRTLHLEIVGSGILGIGNIHDLDTSYHVAGGLLPLSSPGSSWRGDLRKRTSFCLYEKGLKRALDWVHVGDSGAVVINNLKAWPGLKEEESKPCRKADRRGSL
ncbi:hypothetical protein QVD17_17019 [Tagetes erecta]|uniref:Uncharacterized protein n=1 Tax=Tagetes erecta TaxID=13708 RepID=A0AAD8NTY2_TARER|nr:hypothetical protein QVD17_17019 [Tagetes erecta]